MRLDITQFGAVGDGATLCTEAINNTINKVAEGGGGYVIVPPGEYVSGTIILKSNVYLYLEPGSTILGSMEIEDLEVVGKKRKYSVQVFGEDIENSGILGHGTFDLRRANFHRLPKLNGRPLMIIVRDSTNLTFQGVTLLNPGWFTISCENNTNVTFDSLILNTRDCENGDGIDFNGSKNVTISNCKINAGDDAIGLKSGPACENFTITNCVISSNWAGIRIGPESSGDMINITVSNCVFNDCSDAIKLQNYGGCHMEDLTFSNLNMVNVLRPFFFTYNPSHWWRKKTGTFKRVLIDNVIAHMGTRPNWFEDMIIIHGLPNYHIEDVMISNMHVVAPGGGKEDDGSSAENEELFNYTRFPDLMFQWEPYPASCMYIRHVDRIKLDNCVLETVLPDKRPAIVAQDVKGFKITNTDVYGTDGLIRHYKVDNLKVINSEGNVTEESPEYKKLWDDFKAFSDWTEKMIIENDALLTKVNQMQQVATLTVPETAENEAEFTFDHAGGEAYLKLERIASSLKVWVNNKEIYFWDRRNCYEYRWTIAVDMSEAIVPGENTIKIRLDGSSNDFENRNLVVFAPEK